MAWGRAWPGEGVACGGGRGLGGRGCEDAFPVGSKPTPQSDLVSAYRISTSKMTFFSPCLFRVVSCWCFCSLHAVARSFSASWEML